MVPVNQKTEHINNTTQKVALVNSTTNTLEKSRLRERRGQTEPGLVAF